MNYYSSIFNILIALCPLPCSMVHVCQFNLYCLCMRSLYVYKQFCLLSYPLQLHSLLICILVSYYNDNKFWHVFNDLVLFFIRFSPCVCLNVLRCMYVFEYTYLIMIGTMFHISVQGGGGYDFYRPKISWG